MGDRPESDPLEIFESLLEIDRARELSPEGLERYRTRIREIMRRAARDLEDYRKALEADTRSGGRKRRSK